MKKVLLTNAYFYGYSGSELDTLEVANYFLNKGYKVDIFVLKVGEPLINEVSKKIRIITMDDIDKFYDSYDILWAHHYPLVDYLLFSTNVKFDYVHYVCLSSFELLEQIPMYYDNFNLTSVMSYNTKLKLLNENPLYKEEKINIFPNYAVKSFFDYPAKSYKLLKRVAIVSNHIPEELIDVKEMLEKEDVIVDIYGVNYNYVKVDKEVLSNYDLVISIGKTCFYSLAMGIPTYVYDKFGGVGYVTKKNMEMFFHGNFVCMADSKKATKEELYFDIVNNYSFSKSDSSYFKDYGSRYFCFENNMELTLKKLFDTKKFHNNINSEEYFFLRKTSSLYVKKISEYEKLLDKYQYDLSDNKLKCQLFYALDSEEFEEGKSLKKVSSCLGYNKYEVEFVIAEDFNKLRFDVCEKDFVVFSNFRINGEKVEFDYFNMVMIDDKLVSANGDPYIIINKKFFKDKRIKITYCLTDYLVDDVYSLMEEKFISEQNLNLIINGSFYKFYSKIKKMLKIFK